MTNTTNNTTTWRTSAWRRRDAVVAALLDGFEGAATEQRGTGGTRRVVLSDGTSIEVHRNGTVSLPAGLDAHVCAGIDLDVRAVLVELDG